MAFIYALSDPNTNRIRYIGKTIQPINKRFKQHLQLAKHNVKWPVCRWINKLLLSGSLPLLELVEEIPIEEVNSAERMWISLYRASEPDLLNILDGGEGTLGYKHSNEAKQRISKSNGGKVHSNEWNLKNSLGHIGKKASEVTKSRMSIGHPKEYSEEAKKSFTKAQHNQELLRTDNTTGLRGVTYRKRDNSYDVRITVNGKRIHVLNTKNKQRAAQAYLEAVQKYWRETNG